MAHWLPHLLTCTNNLHPHDLHMLPRAHNPLSPSLLPRTFRRWFSTRRCRWMRTYLGHFTKRRMSRLPGRSPPMPAEQRRQGNQNTRRRGWRQRRASACCAMPLQARVTRIAAAPAAGPSAARSQHATAAARQRLERTERLGPLLIERVDGLGGGRRLLHGGGRRRDLLALGCLRAGGGGSGGSVGCCSCHADGGGAWRRPLAPAAGSTPPWGLPAAAAAPRAAQRLPLRRPAAAPCGAGPCATLTMMGAPHLAAQRPRQARRRWKGGPCCGPGTRALMQARGRGPVPRQCSHSTHRLPSCQSRSPRPPSSRPPAPAAWTPLRSPPPWPTYPPTRRST